MGHGVFEVPFGVPGVQVQEVQSVGVIDQIPYQVGIDSGDRDLRRGGEVGLPGVQLGADVVLQTFPDQPCSAGLLGVPEAGVVVVQFVDQDDDVPHGNSATTCCTFSSVKIAAAAGSSERLRREKPRCPGKAT